MKSYRFFTAAALALALFTPVIALAAPGSGIEEIQSMEVVARVDADRNLTVVETFAYDFGSNDRHGMFRVIPERYSRNGGSYNYHLVVDGVTQDGQPGKFSVSRSGGNVSIKIGDPNTLITGVHTYGITYHTDRAINFFDGEGELYWNVTGDDWDVPIDASRFTLIGPTGFDAEAARKVCFTGAYGSTEAECTVRAEGSSVMVAATRPFGPREGMTIAVRFPKGLITPPSIVTIIGQIIRDNAILLLPFGTLAIMLWLWATRGRDPQGRGTVIPHYEPPLGLTPAEMVSLRDQDVPTRAVTATILDLARRGYLKIDFGEEKKWFSTNATYTFIQAKQPEHELKNYEKAILDGLFVGTPTVTLTELKGSFYKTVTKVKKWVMASLVEQKMFSADPSKVRGAYVGFALIVGFMTIWLFSGILSLLTTVSVVASAIIIAIVGYHMPQKTKEGANTLEEVEGFKWFLSVTEKDRLAFTDAPERKPTQFQAFLPAAVAFGVEAKWAEQFKGIDIPPPDYATGTMVSHWNAVNFANGLSSMNTAAASSAYAAPSSSGSGGSGFSGGGSGGGGGGGGGGSW